MMIHHLGHLAALTARRATDFESRAALAEFTTGRERLGIFLAAAAVFG